MVHVEQVLVHERVVRRDLAVEFAGLVAAVAAERRARWAAIVGEGAVAGKDEDQAIDLMGRIGFDAVGQAVAAEIGDVDAPAGLVIGPAVIAAAQGAVLDDAPAERDLAVRAAILQREDRGHPRVRATTIGSPAKRPSEASAGLQLAGPGDRVTNGRDGRRSGGRSRGAAGVGRGRVQRRGRDPAPGRAPAGRACSFRRVPRRMARIAPRCPRVNGRFGDRLVQGDRGLSAAACARPRSALQRYIFVAAWGFHAKTVSNYLEGCH